MKYVFLFFFALSFSVQAFEQQTINKGERIKLTIEGCKEDEFGTIQLMDINTLAAVCKPIICYAEQTSGQYGNFEAKVFQTVLGSGVKRFHSTISFYKLANTNQDQIQFETELRKLVEQGACREAHYEQTFKGGTTTQVVK